MNGKESTQATFLKYTAHEFKKLLNKESSKYLEEFKVVANNKKYEFWKRDSLAIHLYSKDVAYQKLDYIHNNPLTEKWQLVNNPSDYNYSTCSFYEKDIKKFVFIKDLREEF
jgi:hypothetical protein